VTGAPCLAAAAPDLHGRIERITADAVAGWMLDRANPATRIGLCLLLDGKVIAESVADGLRHDLLRTKVGDGRYGFRLVAADAPGDLARAFLEGRLLVEARGDITAPYRVGPSATLEKETRDDVLIRSADTLAFDAFLQVAKDAARSLPPGDVARLLFPLLNASRAHYPEWCHSPGFLDLAVEVASLAGKPLSAAHYRMRRDGLFGAPPEQEPEPSDPPRCYGSLADLVPDDERPAIRLVRASMFRGPSPPSFIEVIGYFPEAEHQASSAVPVLAFREYAFGAPSWHVLREGRRRDVARSLYYLDFEQVLEILNNDGLICIDMSNEGPAFYRHGNNLLNSAITDLGLPRARIIYVTQNLEYQTALGEQEFFGGIAHAHFYIGSGLKSLRAGFSDMRDVERHVRDMLLARRSRPASDMRHYVCLNFTPRAHRWLMALFLLERGHLDDGFVSFPGATHPKMPNNADVLRHAPMVRLRERLMQRVPELLALCPLVLDVQSDTLDTPTGVFPLDHMQRSLFHIVTESEVGGPDIRRVTEKILKPLVGLQPFVVMGNAGSLDILRRMGFRTFEPVLRESYDDVADPAARIDAVFDEVDRLMSVPLDELRERLRALDEIVIHNFLHLIERGPLLFGAAGEARMRRAIGRMMPRAVRQRAAPPP
jgi:hypothetical protein